MSSFTNNNTVLSTASKLTLVPCSCSGISFACQSSSIFSVSVYLSGQLPRAWELQFHSVCVCVCVCVCVFLSKKSVKKPERHWCRVTENWGTGH